MRVIKLIGENFEGWLKWTGCAMGKDGCVYAIPCMATRILKIDPTDDSTTLVGPELIKPGVMYECIASPDGYIYAIPCVSICDTKILKFNPDNQKVSMVGDVLDGKHGATSAMAHGIIYFMKGRKMFRYDPSSDSTSIIDDNLSEQEGWEGAVTAGDGCIYFIPCGARHVLRLDPRNESITLIGNDFGDLDGKWCGGVLGADGNLYGMPYSHNMILKIDIANQTTSLVGPDLGEDCQKYGGGILGHDKCIYMMPCHNEFVMKFNPTTGDISNIGDESLGNQTHKYNCGVLAPNGYIYAPPYNEKQVLKTQSWNNWLYLKYRLLVESRRATRKIMLFNDDLNIVQHFIIHTNDDIFRTMLEMFL